MLVLMSLDAFSAKEGLRVSFQGVFTVQFTERFGFELKHHDIPHATLTLHFQNTLQPRQHTAMIFNLLQASPNPPRVHLRSATPIRDIKLRRMDCGTRINCFISQRHAKPLPILPTDLTRLARPSWHAGRKRQFVDVAKRTTCLFERGRSWDVQTNDIRLFASHKTLFFSSPLHLAQVVFWKDIMPRLSQ